MKQENKGISVNEKIIWAVVIITFFVALMGIFLGQFITDTNFYRMCLAMSVISVFALSLERFYFGKAMGREMTSVFNLGYWLVIAWTVVLLLHLIGVVFLPFIMESDYRAYWITVPTVDLLWMTRYLWGDNLNWSSRDKKDW